MKKLEYQKVIIVEDNTVKYFFGEYFFLSNFYVTFFKIEGITYSSVEHYFQSSKVLAKEDRFKITSAFTPGEAKLLGRRCNLRKDWEEVKIAVMTEGVFAKFAQNKDLKEKLLKTGDMVLEEGNDWRDEFWGVVDGRGENHLGKILMGVREILKIK